MRRKTFIDRNFEILGAVLAMPIVFTVWIAGLAVSLIYAREWVLEHWIISGVIYYCLVFNLGTMGILHGVVFFLEWANKASKRMFG